MEVGEETLIENHRIWRIERKKLKNKPQWPKGNIKNSNIYVIGVSGKQIEIEAENIFKEIIMKNINLNIQESQQTLSRESQEKPHLVTS